MTSDTSQSGLYQRRRERKLGKTTSRTATSRLAPCERSKNKNYPLHPRLVHQPPHRMDLTGFRNQCILRQLARRVPRGSLLTPMRRGLIRQAPRRRPQDARLLLRDVWRPRSSSVKRRQKPGKKARNGRGKKLLKTWLGGRSRHRLRPNDNAPEMHSDWRLPNSNLRSKIGNLNPKSAWRKLSCSNRPSWLYSRRNWLNNQLKRWR